MSWSFNLITDFESGLTLAAEAFQGAAHSYVFSHPALLKAWCDTYRPLRKLDPIFVSGNSSDGNRVIFPLVLWHRNWKNAFIRKLIPIGYSDFDYLNPIFSRPLSQTEVEPFWHTLTQFLNANVNYDELTFDGITDRLALRTDNWQQAEICPMLRLDGISDEESLMKFFKTSLRGDIRRQMRRLSEIGEVTMKEFQGFDKIPEETFGTFMYHHALRWPNAYKAPRFHKNLLKEGLKAGCVHFSTLMAGDTEVAWHLGFEHASRYYYYMPAANQEYLKFSPVKLHLFHLVRRAVENQLTIFDHLRGEENYKDGWSNDHQHVNFLNINSSSLSASLKHNLMRIRRITPPEIIICISIVYAVHHDNRNAA